MEVKPLKLYLTAEQIYRREFSGSKPGYDCLQVDTLLDSVIKDYESFDEYYAQSQQALTALERDKRILEERNQELEQRLGRMESELSELRPLKGTLDQHAGDENLSLIKRIAHLEEALRGAGIDPSSVE